MKSPRILIAEDETIVAEELAEILSENAYQVVGKARNAVDALRMAASYNPDIVLVDIGLEGEDDGISLARELKERFGTKIIFLTALDGDEVIERAAAVNPVAYLTKPFAPKHLLATLKLASKQVNGASQKLDDDSYVLKDRLFIKTEDQFRKVMFTEITYVEAVGSYCRLHLAGSNHTLAINLKTFLSRAKFSFFLRVHRSFVVNLNMVDSFSGNTIHIGKKEVPLSAGYKEQFLRSLNYL